MQKILKYIILFGIFTLPLINSRITELLGLSFSMPVSGNYEFTKVMFFNIWSSLVISLFFIQKFLFKNSPSLKGRGLGDELILFYIIIIISTIFSESPITSFLGNSEKSHSFLMWSNLVGLFIVFKSLFLSPVGGKYPKGDRGIISFPLLIKTFILSGIFVSIIGLKEYFFPTFDYGELGNRLFSTFGHPNYLGIFLVALLPFLYQKEGIINKIIILLFIITLLLTKSFIAIFLFIIFNIYISPFFKGSTRRGRDYLPLFILLFVFGFSLIYNFLPEKLHSFISRYFIWETTLRIIFSDFKIFLFGGGLDTLTFYFSITLNQNIFIYLKIYDIQQIDLII
ncbi:MAG: hypothetical protein Q9M97_06265 [Candidatus Gracilibacteria bacterium]|nr:hypothetical protein [Candidatus Gracilibacteria bacterium]